MMKRAGASTIAFTLIELLVTVAVIGILAAMLLPALGRAKESGRAASCQGNLHQIGLALQIYVDESGNRMPTMRDFAAGGPTNQATIDVVLAGQLGSPQVLRCPSDNQGIFDQTKSSYSWNNLVNGENADHLQVFTLSLTDTKVPLVFDKQKFHSLLGANHAMNYLYADGHIKNLLVLGGTK
jgi:prepilin-type N-terminal cleavage/methylation domain-containing protein/prepilin-type processing-associated H-X9-DG protein